MRGMTKHLHSSTPYHSNELIGPPAPRYSASYLVLFGNSTAPRAALFDDHERLLAEMIGDDGYAIDTLINASGYSAPPRPAMVDAIEALDPQAELEGAACFRLD